MGWCLAWSTASHRKGTGLHLEDSFSELQLQNLDFRHVSMHWFLTSVPGTYSVP